MANEIAEDVLNSTTQTICSKDFLEGLGDRILTELPKESLIERCIKSATIHNEVIFCADQVIGKSEAHRLSDDILDRIGYICRRTNLRPLSVDCSDILTSKEHGEINNYRRNKLLVRFTPNT